MKCVLVSLLSLCLALGGCSTTRAVSIVEVGKKVTLTMKSAEKHRLKVTAVDADTLTGTSLDQPRGRMIQVSRADVESMSSRQFSSGRTLGLIGGIAGGLLVLAVAGMYAAVLTCEDCSD